MGSSVGRLRTSEGVGTRILIMVCVLRLASASSSVLIPKMCILGLAVLTKIIIDAVQTVISHSSYRLFVAFVA